MTYKIDLRHTSYFVHLTSVAKKQIVTFIQGTKL